MTDLSQTIIPKSDQMNADDLIGGTITIKITKVSLLAGEQPVAIGYEGDNGKPYKPCKSMRRVLVIIWGSNGNNYVGRSMTLYRDDKVTFGAMAVGGIRISHMSHIDNPITLALTASKANRKPFTVNPLITQDDDIERIKELGRAEADKGAEALKIWWGNLGGARHKQLGVTYLNEIKKTAAEADNTIDDEKTPLVDPLNASIDAVMQENGIQPKDDEENAPEPYTSTGGLLPLVEVPEDAKRNGTELKAAAKLVIAHMKETPKDFRQSILDNYEPGLLKSLADKGLGSIAGKIREALAQ